MFQVCLVKLFFEFVYLFIFAYAMQLLVRICFFLSSLLHSFALLSLEQYFLPSSRIRDKLLSFCISYFYSSQIVFLVLSDDLFISLVLRKGEDSRLLLFMIDMTLLLSLNLCCSSGNSLCSQATRFLLYIMTAVFILSKLISDFNPFITKLFSSSQLSVQRSVCVSNYSAGLFLECCYSLFKKEFL